MGRSFRPPKPPPLPSTLPLESQSAYVFNSIAHSINQSALGQKMRGWDDKLPEIESVEFPTPFGFITTPHVQTPSLNPPELDERKRNAVKASAAMDLAELIDMIPGVGLVTTPIGDAVNDTFVAKLQDLMSESEWQTFRELDKVSPLTTLATVRTFAKVQK